MNQESVFNKNENIDLTKAEVLLDRLYEKLRLTYEEVGINDVLVRGAGPFFPKLALIGEAPGGSEERSGKVFVGSAGKILNSFLQLIQIDRDSVYITNVVKFRPKKISKRSGKPINRTPSNDEISLSAPFLFEELKIVSPKIIVTMGNTALHAVTSDNSLKITDFHGKLISVSDLIVYPIYHPASIIYNPAINIDYEKDLLNLQDILKQN